jgi:hypothetical protein
MGRSDAFLLPAVLRRSLPHKSSYPLVLSPKFWSIASGTAEPEEMGLAKPLLSLQVGRIVK